MKGIKKLVIFFLFGIMLTFSVRAPLRESIDPTDSEVIIKTSANNQYVIHNYTQETISEEEKQPFVVKKSNNISAECKCHFFFNRSRQKEGVLFKQRARSMIDPVRSISLRRGYNEIKREQMFLLCDIGRDGKWITKRKLLK